jgi:hypothetical protein
MLKQAREYPSLNKENKRKKEKEKEKENREQKDVLILEDAVVTGYGTQTHRQQPVASSDPTRSYQLPPLTGRHAQLYPPDPCFHRQKPVYQGVTGPTASTTEIQIPAIFLRLCVCTCRSVLQPAG